MVEKMRILVLEPYYGGSHKAFLNGLEQNIAANFVLFHLPARKWKMRMQLSAPWFVEQLYMLEHEQRWFDTVLCSTFVDVAVFRGLAGMVPGWNSDARFCTYFHENQFAYPTQSPKQAAHQFTAINFTTALASDRIAFNSQYNMQTFMDSSRRYVKKAADMSITSTLDELSPRSIILQPGMDYTLIDQARVEKSTDTIPVIVWNHRWEHDKNPEEFFAALHGLKRRGVCFRLILLGQSFQRIPHCFTRARGEFAEELIHFGYVDSPADYAQLLKKGDIVVSTAFHEFFGIAVMEAVRAGCLPVVPDRLSYPEIYPASYRFLEGQLVDRLEEAIVHRSKISETSAYDLTEPYSWASLAPRFEQWLFGE